MNSHPATKTKTFQILNRLVGQALHQYDMIADGDRILVGISGGWDSLTLLWFLQERLARIKVRYHIHAVYLDPGFGKGLGDELSGFCKSLGLDLRAESTDFGIKAHGPQNRKNPCFLCSWLRRKRLFEIAGELGCTKIALGHHKDDLIETLFLNMFYTGAISTMKPAQPFFGGHFILIRPLAFIEEHLIKRFAGESGFPGLTNPCPSAGGSKRREIKDMLNRMYITNPKIKGNIFRSLGRVKTEYLL